MLDNLQLFIDEINSFVRVDEEPKLTIDSLRFGNPWMTEVELFELDMALGKRDVHDILSDIYEIYDAGEPQESVEPIIQAAFEWLVGPFEVTHPDYDPYWFRESVSR